MTQVLAKSKSHLVSSIRRRVVMTAGAAILIAVCAVAALAAISFVLKWGTTGTANGQFLSPNAIAVDVLGNVYVAEGNGNRVQKFDGGGNFILKFGAPGSAAGEFVTTSGIAVDSLG